MDTLWAIVGLLLIAAIVWEVFNDLFQPSGTGAVSDWVARRLFQICKRTPRTLPLAGPIALVTVIALWVAGLMVGFALLFYTTYPGAFRTSTGAVPADSSRLLPSLYFSFETLTTLGYGDIVPQSGLIRLLANIEGLVGFGLLTASVSSIVLLYPALARMRLLARGVAHIVEGERTSGTSLAATQSDIMLSSLARDVTHARIDLVHFPLVYYFVSEDPKAAVATWVRELVRLAGEARQPDRPEQVRLAGHILDHSLHEFAAILDGRFLHTKSHNREVIFDALAADHLVNR